MAIAPPPPPQATASSYVFFCGFLALILFLIWYSVSGTPQPPARYDNAKPRVEPITGFRKLHAADRQPPRGSGPAADISKLRPHPEPAEIPKIRTAGCQPPAEFAAEIHASDSQPPPASAEIPKAHGAESQPHTEPEATLEGIAGSSTAAEEANTTLTQRSATPSPVKKNDYWSYARRAWLQSCLRLREISLASLTHIDQA
ncbi:hypothetical protein BV25DRAFT_1175654 [Artomyces pyxidatus]|uniref:Uncharacterized protein n=1 Tax=Artomyces pyxidatus TaxID=48021 RepID=A0ACB8SSS8_9AGAM|nr:hypothetical protein BV25DRAFT_1175654 [Artomyces pyxidatus]